MHSIPRCHSTNLTLSLSGKSKKNSGNSYESPTLFTENTNKEMTKTKHTKKPYTHSSLYHTIRF